MPVATPAMKGSYFYGGQRVDLLSKFPFVICTLSCLSRESSNVLASELLYNLFFF